MGTKKVSANCGVVSGWHSTLPAIERRSCGSVFSSHYMHKQGLKAIILLMVIENTLFAFVHRYKKNEKNMIHYFGRNI